MARAFGETAVLDRNGNVQSNIVVDLLEPSTGLRIADTVYADALSGSTLSLPLTSDSSGRVVFYLALGKLVTARATISGTAYDDLVAVVDPTASGGGGGGGAPTGPAGGDLAGSYPNPTLSTVTVAKGGTGLATLSAGQLVVGNGVSAVIQDAGLAWDNTAKKLTVSGAGGLLMSGVGMAFSPPSDLATKDLTSTRSITTTSTNTRFEPWQLVFTNLSSDVASPGTQIYRGIASTAIQGDATHAAVGTLLASRFVVAVTQNGNASTEFAPSMWVMRDDSIAGTPGNLWLADLNLHGPIAIRPNALKGFSIFSNNYYNGSPTLAKGTAAAITTFAGSGGAVGSATTPAEANSVNHLTATTFPYDIGLLIVGASGVPGTNAGVGFTTAIQIGGGSGTSDNGPWNVTASHIGTGLHIRDFGTGGIILDNPDTGSPFGIAVAEGVPVWIGVVPTTKAEALSYTWSSTATGLHVRVNVATTPAVRIEGDGLGIAFQLDSYGGATANTTLQGRHARGTLAIPTATQTGDILLRLSGGGFQTTTSVFATSKAAIDLVAVDNFTSTANGTKIELSTTATGASALTLRWRVDQDGSLIGVSGVNADLSALTGFFKVPSQAGAAPTAASDLRYDTTQDSFVMGGHGALTGHVPRVLSVQVSSSDTLTNTVSTEQSFATTWSIPANFLISGKTLRLTFGLSFTSGGTAASETYKLKLGSTYVYTASPIAPGNSQTGRGVSLVFDILGTAAAGASVNTHTDIVNMPIVSNGVTNLTAQPVLIATNAAQTVTLTLTFSSSTGADSVTLRTLIVEELN